VRIRATIDGRTGILLSLPNGETPRKLEQGESQVWEIDWERLLNSLEREKPQVRVTALVAIAQDTTGKDYVQKEQAAFTMEGLLGIVGRLGKNLGKNEPA